MGRREIDRFVHNHRIPVKETSSSRNSYRFADTILPSVGRAELFLDTPPGIPPVGVTLGIVNASVPALLGMDVLDKESLVVDTVSHSLRKRVPVKDSADVTHFVDLWSIPLLRSRSNHVYAGICTSVPVLFTKPQLQKLHRQFFHPSAMKLFNLLRKARPEEATTETLQILEDICKSCDPCQRIKNAPSRFKVSFGAEHVSFNERIILDIMYMRDKPVLHIVDEGTRFTAARFLSSVSTKAVWDAILQCWAYIYTGLPNRMLVDQGKAFTGVFIDISKMSDVAVEATGIQAHSSLNVGERYHHPLRQTYRKILIENPTCPPEEALAAAVKAMNDTVGPEGFVPSALVFGEFPRVHTASSSATSRPSLSSRAKVANTARSEMEHHMASLRLQRALRHTVPPAADHSYRPGDKVLVWREKHYGKHGEWIGPFPVFGTDEAKKLVFVQDIPVGPSRPYNFAQVKLYRTPETATSTNFQEIHSRLKRFSSVPTFLTETLQRGDPRVFSTEMTAAKEAEIKNLLDRGTFAIIPKKDVPLGANVLPGRFVLTIKSSDDGQVKHKARYVIGGHRDRFKDFMVHSATTLQPQSVRLMLAMSAMHDFEIWTSDVRQAYLQSAEPLGRDIFIKTPVPAFNLKPDECLKLLKPLYGLCESGDLWHATLDKHHRKDLGMVPLRSDPSLYALKSNGKLEGLAGGYVDDLIRTGTPRFKNLSLKTNEMFDMAADQELPCIFTGFSLHRGVDNVILLEQHEYLRKLEHLDVSSDFSAFRSMRMRLAWLANSRPDCLFEISQLAQVTEDMYMSDRTRHVKNLNKAVNYAINNKVSLRIPKLDQRSLRVLGFSDASFSTNADLTSQLGHIVFLGDSSDSVIPISFKSYKSKRVTRSVMAGEVIAFSDLFDVAVTISLELRHLLDIEVPVQLFTDSKCLFDVISKGSRTSEKRMMIDIAAAREGFKRKEISDIGFVRSSNNIADGLTKAMNQSALLRILSTSTLHVNAEQCIMRN